VPRRNTLIPVVLCAAALLVGCARARTIGQAGDAAIEAKDYRRAVVEYRLDVAAQPQSGELRRKLAMAYELSGNIQASATEYVRAADLLPNDPKAQLDAAARLLLTGKFEDAKTRAEVVLKAEPKNVQAHIVRGNAMARLGDATEAVSGLQDAIDAGSPTAESFMTLGGLELGRGKAEEAEAAFKQALVVGKDNPSAYIALANFYRALGRYRDAEPALKKALELDPKNSLANRLLARLYLSSGRAADAEAPLKAIVADTGTPEGKLALSEYYVAQGRDNDARAILNELISSKQGGVVAQARIAGLDYKQGRVAQAHKAVADLVANDKRNAQLLVLQGGWFAQENNLDAAFQSADAAVQADANFAPARALLGAIYARKGNVPEAIEQYQQVIRLSSHDSGANIELAKLHLQSAQAQQAISFAEAAVREQPLDGAAHVVLASALLADGQLDRAESEAKLIVKGAPNRPEGHQLMGEVLYRRNQPALARKSFEQALRLDPGSTGASNGLARIEVGSKQTPQAVARIDAQFAKNPKNARLALLAGRAHASAGEYDKAESLFKQAIELDPSFAAAYNTLGQLYVQQNKLDQARREYEGLVAKQPSNVQAHTMVAMLLHAKGKIAEAKSQYEKIVALDQRASVAANNLAYLYATDGGNLDQALNLAQSAKASAPDDPDVDDTLGWIYYKRGLPALAVEPLRRSVAKEPKNALFHFHLGMVYVKAGDASNARSMLERAVSLGLDSQDAAEAQRALATLRG
jgi:tetratricopeptide (TPR) repeat protein